MSFWPSADCQTGTGEDDQPYYVQDCVSRSEGQCNEAAAGVKSFRVGVTTNASEQAREGTCRSFAVEGKGSNVDVWRVGAVLGCFVVMIEAIL